VPIKTIAGTARSMGITVEQVFSNAWESQALARYH
jgi:hypothetical protein